MDLVGNRIDADVALAKLGAWGKYQLWVYNLACFPWVFAAAQMMSMAFVNVVPQHACVQSEAEAFNVAYNGMWESYSQCSYPDNETLEDVICYENGTSFITFDHSLGNTVAIEWLLVCGKRFLAELAGSLFMFGILVGSLVLPGVADRWGRRWVVIISCWSLGAFGVLAAVVPTYSAFATMRFLGGVTYAGTTLVGWVLACEVLAPRLRAYATIGMGIWWTGGYCLLAPLAYGLPNWRALMLAISIPLAITFSYIWLLPESLHWFVAMNRWADAESWIAHAAKVNNVSIRLEECLQSPLDLDEDFDTKSTTMERRQRSVLSLFTSKVVLLHTLLMAYLWLCNTFVYYGLSLFSTSLIGDRYVNFALSGLVELPAYFVTPPLLNWPVLGRRWTIAGFHILAGVALLLLMAIPEKTGSGTDLVPLIVTLWLIGKFAISCTFGAIFVYGAELFPTTVRSAGLGLCGVSSRIGGILAPYIGLIAMVSKRLPPSLFGISSLLAAFVTLLLPETVGTELPEDIQEVEFGPWLNKCCSGFRKPPIPTRNLSYQSNVPDLLLSATEKDESLREKFLS